MSCVFVFAVFQFGIFTSSSVIADRNDSVIKTRRSSTFFEFTRGIICTDPDEISLFIMLYLLGFWREIREGTEDDSIFFSLLIL